MPSMGTFSNSVDADDSSFSGLPALKNLNVGNFLPGKSTRGVGTINEGGVEISANGTVAKNSAQPDFEDSFKQMNNYVKDSKRVQQTISGLNSSAQILNVPMTATLAALNNPTAQSNPVAIQTEASNFSDKFSLLSMIINGVIKAITKLQSATS
jgi:hypothetical protein